MRTAIAAVVILSACALNTRAQLSRDANVKEAVGVAAGIEAAAGKGLGPSDLDRVFEDVKKASSYKGKISKVYYPQPGQKTIPLFFQGKGAAAGSPGVGWNDVNPGSAVIAVTKEIFLLSDGADQLAFWLAHEMAHIEAGDPAALEAFYAAEYAKWEKRKLAAKDQGYLDRAAGADDAAEKKTYLQKYFEEENEQQLAAFQKPLERNADDRALRMLAAYPSKAKPAYDLDRAALAPLNLPKLEKKYGFKLSATHASPADRAKELQAKAKAIRGAP